MFENTPVPALASGRVFEKMRLLGLVGVGDEVVIGVCTGEVAELPRRRCKRPSGSWSEEPSESARSTTTTTTIGERCTLVAGRVSSSVSDADSWWHRWLGEEAFALRKDHFLRMLFGSETAALNRLLNGVFGARAKNCEKGDVRVVA